MRKQLIYFTIFLLILTAVLPFFSIQLVDGVSGHYEENFSNSVYLDTLNSNATGWGQGNVTLSTTKPELVGSYDFSTSAINLFVKGDLAYVVGSFIGLNILNISNPSNPVLVSSFATSGYAEGVAVRNNFTYIADVNDIVIVNTTDPFNPVAVSTIVDGSSSRDLCIVGNVLFVAGSTKGLLLYNITNPSSPSFLGSYDTLNSAEGVFVQGDFAYVADGLYGDLIIVDISDLHHPSYVSRVPLGTNPVDVFVQGDFAYVADTHGYVYIININDKNNPYLAVSYEDNQYTTGVTGEGSFLYVAAHYGGVIILDITQPTKPVVQTSFKTKTDATEVFLKDGLLYVTAGGPDGLSILKISDMVEPKIIGTFHSNWVSKEVYIDGNIAYVADSKAGVLIVNITDPTLPSNITTYHTVDRASGVFVSGDYLYIADSTGGLQIVNIADPVHPTNVTAFYPHSSYTINVYVEGNIAYLANGAAGILFVNVTNPSNPTLIGSTGYVDFVRDIFVQGDLVYACAGQYLKIFNVNNPTKPIQLGSYHTGLYSVLSLYVDGTHAYIAAWDEGLQIVDVSNPYHPSNTTAYKTPYGAYGVFVSGDYVYVAIDYCGLIILDISTPSNPQLYDVISTEGNAASVVIYGENAYVANGASGLTILQVRAERGSFFEKCNIVQSLAIYNNPLVQITRAELVGTISTPLETSLSFYLSSDNGNHWELVPFGTNHTFTNSGDTLLWKVILVTSNTIKTPSITSIIINYYFINLVPEFGVSSIIFLLTLLGVVSTVAYYFRKRR
ncbi:MAG: hypothetical protein ACTSSF_03915 [Candidatus Heimdallarchaeaceae archaeon]